MRTFKTRRTVRHSADQMFELVADVERYPAFVPLCQNLKVRDRRTIGGKETLTADMTVAYKMFAETFKSRVTLDRAAQTILVEYLDGPFKSLENRWRFMDLAEGGSEVDFYIAYAFKSFALDLLVGSVFDKVYQRMVEAFEIRADAIYRNVKAASTA
ncbi:MAG: type II toxin-antitoxin system RatA family toxin [Hyphomicrobiaceae bacterium]